MTIDWPKFPFRLIPSYQTLGVSLAQLDEALRYGSITELEYRWRVLFWTWGAARFEGLAGAAQERCYSALGYEGVQRRMRRVEAIKGRYVEEHYGEWKV